MKYFFLTDGWTVGRVWGSDGLWNETAWRRRPEIQRLNLCLVEESEKLPEGFPSKQTFQDSEKLWLYRVEDDVLTVEVKPIAAAQVDPSAAAIGQVVLKRLISAEQVLERLGTAQTVCELIISSIP